MTTPPMTPLEKEWLEFKAAAVPANACAEQIIDMKISFYSGVLTATQMFMRITKNLENEDGFAAMEQIVKEAHNFMLSSAGIPTDTPQKPH